MKVNSPFQFYFSNEFEMTKFIREQVVKRNPYYNANNEPSRWMPFIVLMLATIAVDVIALTFIGR